MGEWRAAAVPANDGKCSQIPVRGGSRSCTFGLAQAWAGRRKAREAASAISTRRRLWLAAGARPGLLTQPELEFETDGIESINQRALTVFLVAYLGTAG